MKEGEKKEADEGMMKVNNNSDDEIVCDKWKVTLIACGMLKNRGLVIERRFEKGDEKDWKGEEGREAK
jgi:hypothetical protein